MKPLTTKERGWLLAQDSQDFRDQLQTRVGDLAGQQVREAHRETVGVALLHIETGALDILHYFLAGLLVCFFAGLSRYKSPWYTWGDRRVTVCGDRRVTV